MLSFERLVRKNRKRLTDIGESIVYQTRDADMSSTTSDHNAPNEEKADPSDDPGSDVSSSIRLCVMLLTENRESSIIALLHHLRS